MRVNTDHPAGMNDLSGRIDFGASYFVPTVEYKATESTGMGGAVINHDGSTIESDRGGSPVPAFGLIVPLNDKIKFGVGAYGVAGMGVDYNKISTAALPIPLIHRCVLPPAVLQNQRHGVYRCCS